ncbi:translocase of outer mitochondrial membrane 22 homolog mge [Lycorma delicatula]|uniref:translocase of outer mitochondrial membrane 22 homolog mge n=1 Tax=Lycorma delicatula TaxID=130591 RepID=UPI003F5150DF
MAVGEENDSGMGSLVHSSKDVTPEKPKSLVEESDDEDFEDESFAERLYGLTEMLPDSLVKKTESFLSYTKSAIQDLYKVSRTVTWAVFSSSVILVAPIIFEVERAQMEEAQRSQQKQMLLGPNAAMSGSGIGPAGGMTLMPPR